MHKKSQASLEFLITYAWALLAIAITLGALYYFGILDFSKYLPQKCIFPTQFKCLDFSLQGSEVRIKLVNNLGEDVTINTLSITNDAAAPIICSTTVPVTPFTWDQSTEKDVVFQGCSGGGYLDGERVELGISLNYFAQNTPSRPIHVVNGRVNGRVR